MIDIRPATLDMISLIVPVWRELMDLHESLDPFYALRPEAQERFREYTVTSIRARDSLLLVAVEDSVVLAYSIASITPYPPVYKVEYYGEITDLAVTTSRRGEGLGSRLVEAMLEWFDSRGVKRMQLNVAVENRIAENFWRRQGFSGFQLILARNL